MKHAPRNDKKKVIASIPQRLRPLLSISIKETPSLSSRILREIFPAPDKISPFGRNDKRFIGVIPCHLERSERSCFKISSLRFRSHPPDGSPFSPFGRNDILVFLASGRNEGIIYFIACLIIHPDSSSPSRFQDLSEASPETPLSHLLYPLSSPKPPLIHSELPLTQDL